MDNSHYPSNVINNNGNHTTSSYPSPSSTSSQGLQQQQHHNSLPPHTLPPLQPHNPMMQQPAPPYGSYPHTPRTPATPNTPGSTGAMSNYPPPPTQNVGRAPYPGMMPSNQSYQNHQGYPTTTSMLPHTSTSMVHPQPIAPAPSPGGRVPPVLRPMPAGGVIPQPGISSPYSQSPLMQQPQMMQEGDQPTHVVGSQGRRGILPSAPGRPQAPVAGSPAAKNQIPQKDADGKFPCPHCNKTYLHAKHLKRHLLRHTGDRPYMCVLCRDTFSRSDILKRHFQKCSIRRGNPTGASHLSHPHAHVKKNPQAQKQMGNENELQPINGMGQMGAPDGMVHPFGLIQTPDGMGNMANDQNHLSRQSSMNRIDDPNDRDRRNVQGSVMGGSTHQGYNGNIPHSMAANINPQLANYPMQPGQNGVPMFGGQASNQQSGLDWSQMFQAGAQGSYINTFPPPNVGQTQIATIKQEPNVDTGRPDGVPGGSLADRSLFFDDDTSWAPPSLDNGLAQNPYQILHDRLINFFCSPDQQDQARAAALHVYFTPDSIRDYLHQYTHFHRHFSILHIPTFRIMDAYTGLLAGVCCVGACYSDIVSADEVRTMMNFLKSALEQDSQLLASMNDDGVDPEIKYGNLSFGDSQKDIEELQAIMLMHTLFIWNGTPEQRDSARNIYPVVAVLARKTGLLSVSQTSTLYSAVHQQHFTPSTFDVSKFNWMAWVEQEKRIRILFLIYLCDAGLGLYFNDPPQLDPLELQIPLPADDAPWEASNPTACAEALGLYGPDAARARNPYGTRRYKQPETSLALRALLHSSYQMQTGATNLYGKFILIHALLALMRRAQVEGLSTITAGPSTPLSQVDWVVQGGSGQDGQWPNSASSSGRVTPVDGTLRPEVFKMFATALDKFKRNWDSDMANQFPQTPGQGQDVDVMNPHRKGFSRDGIHFYWLGNYMLKNTKPGDLTLPADERLRHMMHLLKSVNSWVMSDGMKRGEEMGSIGEIDKDYGIGTLTLDMVNLFKPLHRVVESSGIASVKTEID